MDRQQAAAELQSLLDALVAKDKLIHNAVMGVAHGGSDFAWSGAAGYADASDTRPMRPETPVLVASVTKIYTAVAVLMLQERGKLSLGDQISKYLSPDLIQGLHRFQGTDYTDQITIRHLVTMTSGIADYSLDKPKHGKPTHERLFTEGDYAFSLEDVTRLVREELTPKFAPGVKAHYSDTNYLLLGAIIEAIEQKDLQAVFEELFFQPLGMTQSYLYGTRTASAAGAPATMFHQGRSLDLDKALRCVGPHGGLVTTVSDSLRFLQAVTRGELFANQDTFASMQQWTAMYFPFQYGYGLMRFKMPRWLSPFAPSPELVGHSGSNGSFLYYIQEQNLYLAGTINQFARQRAPFPLMLKAAEIIRKMR